MTQYKEPEIIRTEDIVVRSTAKNTDGYLVVTDEGGNEHKVSPKRERLFSVFQPGTAVHLAYAVFKEKEYIANATPLEQMIKTIPPKELGKAPESKPLGTKPATEKKTAEMSKDDWAEKDRVTRTSIERQKSLDIAGNLCVAGKIPIDEVVSYATVYGMYLSGEFVESESDIIVKYLAKYGRKK